MKNFLVLAISALFLATPVAAQDTLDWDIVDQNAPVSLEEVSNNTTTVQTVRLVTDSENEPVSPANFSSSDDFEFKYSGEIDDMGYLQNGYWYADFKPDTENSTVEYQLVHSDGSQTTEENITDTVNTGNLTVDILTEIEGYVIPGESVTLEANLTDEWNEQHEPEADVDVYLTNGSSSEQIADLGYSQSRDVYSLEVDMPEKSNASYVLHVNATDSDASFNNAFGSESRVFETYPRDSGVIEYINASSGCNNESFFDSCGRGATVETGYNMTAFDASEVNLSIKAPLKNGSLRQVDSWEMEKNDIWELEFDVPDLNTSKYSNEMRLDYNATVGDDQLIDSHNVTYATYEMTDASENSVRTTQDFNMRASIEKPFTGDSLERSRLNRVNATIYDPSGDVFENFDLEDLEQFESSGFYGRDVYVPRDVEEGTYELNVTAWNVYNTSKSFERPFTVSDIDSTFNVTEEIEFQFIDMLPHEETVEITNHRSNNMTLNVSFDGEIENITTVADGDGNVTINGSDTENVTVSFDPESIRDYEGEIVFTDENASFDEEVDVDLYAPSCETASGRLCLDTGEWVNATLEEPGTVNTSFELSDPREGNLSVAANELTDDSDFFEVSPSGFTLQEDQEMNVSFTAEEPGNYTGEFEIVTDNYAVNLLTGLNAEFEPRESSVSLPSSLDLGAVTEGNDVTQTIEIENTGDLEVTSLDVESETYDVEIEDTSIPAGETAEPELTFSSVEDGSGSITVISETEDESISSTVAVATTLESGFIDDSPSLNESENGSSDPSPPPTDPSDELSNEDDTSGGMLVPIAVAVLVLLIVGFVFFTSYVPEEGDPLYSVMGE